MSSHNQGPEHGTARQTTESPASRQAAERLDLRPIAILLGRIRDRWQPEQIWLFGSRARGDAQPASDWDLFVVVPDTVADADLGPEIAWRLQQGSGATADVIPCRASDFYEDRSTPNTLAFDAAREGLLLYER